jgi:hypothetical protein
MIHRVPNHRFEPELVDGPTRIISDLKGSRPNNKITSILITSSQIVLNDIRGESEGAGFRAMAGQELDALIGASR